MHRPIFGHSFAVLVAPILLSVLAFQFLIKKKPSVRGNAEDSDTDTPGSSTTPTGTNSRGSSSTPPEAANDASSSSIAPSGDRYEVFLSFSGRDTRLGFTDHLYNGLIDARIHTFRDNEELGRGKKIGDDLFAAIKNSKILIPILSMNYGTSSWCLNELVQIMECKKSDTETIVLPIFYKVEPSHVGHLLGSFGDEFRKREKRLCKRKGFDSTILKKWKEALEEVSSLKGHNATGPEGELVKLVVREVLSKLIAKFELDIPENLIGIDSHVEEVKKFVADNSHATLFVGIHGMGGIGKTTLAKSIYNQLLNQFEHHSFIADIREKYKNGVEQLQNKFIHDILKKENLVRDKDEGIKLLSSKFEDKKVLILLDDVDVDDHLKYLAGSRDWFSSGSVIIITTRDKSILDKARVDYKHDHQVLDKDSSLILFSRHAFRNDAPASGFGELTDEVVSTTGRLPLSLKVLGSFLCDKSLGVWKDTIKQLRNVLDKEVQETLRISYDALEDGQQQIFLDIACFFIGMDLRIPSYMWDACDFYPKKGIEVLKLRSLIKVGENHELIMHDQLRDLGRAIVRQEDKKNPWNRSRLWDSKEVMEVLEEDKGTEKIEAISLGKNSSKDFGETTNLRGEQFRKLRNLRFLDTSGAHFSGKFEKSIKELKWLQWRCCPSNFEAKKFHATELVVLDLWGSNISSYWGGWSFIMMARKLKYLNLGACKSLKETSFLSAFENLEVLILSDCEGLEQIDSSIGNMKSLVNLVLTDCENLEQLPAEVGRLEALEQLFLDGCRISSLPDSIGDLQNLEILSISGTWIKELPGGIGRLRKLRELNASRCHRLGGKMPESICNLSSLQRLYLHSCEKLQLPSLLTSSLTYLSATGPSHRLPSLSNLTHLKELQLSDGELLECIREHPSIPVEKAINTSFELEILVLHGCSLTATLDVSLFNHLRTLSVEKCYNVLEIRGLEKSQYLERLEISDCASIKRLVLPKLKGLKILQAPRCKNLVEIVGLDKCEFLEELDLNCCTSIKRLDLSKSKDLKILDMHLCENLVDIQGLDKLESLEALDIMHCASLERLNLPESKGLKHLNADNCVNLVEIQGLHRLESMELLWFIGCRSIERLDLPKSKGMKIFSASGCKNLVEIQGLNRLESLEKISISGCTSIQSLDLPKSKVLKKLSLKSCEKLIQIQGLDRLEFLEELNMSGCTSFGKLPDLCCFDTLRKLAINCFDNLYDIQGLERFPSCERLRIENYKSLAKFPNFSNFHDLWTLRLLNCHELQEIPALATSLRDIAILGCSSIEILPDFSSCIMLFSLVVQDCEKLTELRGLEKLEHLVELDISGCKSLKKLPTLRRTRINQNYEIVPFDTYYTWGGYDRE